MNRDRLTAALITLLISVLIMVALFAITLSAKARSPLVPEDRDDDEILFTEVEMKQIPFKPVRAAHDRPAASAAAEVSGVTDHDSGAGEESEPLLSAAEPSPATQEQPKEEPKPAAKPQPKPDPREEAAARIRNRVGKSTVTKADEGAGKSDKGNAPQGQTTGKSDGLGMDGRQRLNSPVPSITNATGRVTVRIAVNADGHVTSATVTGTSGFGSREQEVRSACEAASRQLLYSPDHSRPTQRGTITWIIK